MNTIERIALLQTLHELETDDPKLDSLSPMYKQTLMRQLREELGIANYE